MAVMVHDRFSKVCSYGTPFSPVFFCTRRRTPREVSARPDAAWRVASHARVARMEGCRERIRAEG